MPPPLHPRAAVSLGDGVFVCGDHRDTASIQGALVSGNRTAEAVHTTLAWPSAAGIRGGRWAGLAWPPAVRWSLGTTPPGRRALGWSGMTYTRW